MSESNRLDGKLVVLVGGSGFLGARVAEEVLRRGARLRVASRHGEHALKLKPLGNLGQVQFAPCDVRNRDQLAAAVTGADAVVYLVGAFAGDVEALQRDGAALAASAAKASGASAFVHVSAIGANADSDVRYARTKAEGEEAVLSAFPQASIIRPSVLFGEDDNFINLFAGLISTFPVLPVFGPDAKLQPLFVDDAAKAIANALADPGKHGGRTYEIGGPQVVTMGELNRKIAAAQGRKRLFAELPDQISCLIAAATGWLPGAPITLDQWKLLEAGSVASGAFPGIKALGVTPRPLDLFLDRWMVRYRHHGRFGVRTAG
jgi:NADH dehydrogenase